MATSWRNVRFTPKSRHWNSVAKCPLCAKSGHSALRQRFLFDHVVGASKQRRRNIEAKRTGSLQIDDEFKLGRLQNRKIGGLSTFEDAAGINAHLPKYVTNAGPVAHQQASCDHFARKTTSGYSVTRCERDKLRGPTAKKRIRRYEKGIYSLSGNSGKGGVYFGGRCSVEKD